MTVVVRNAERQLCGTRPILGRAVKLAHFLEAVIYSRAR